ncbi:hypothetical protein [Paracoccus sp. (in: a-proteobacteria)]|uniref:hypothetical protein n=1 Tax=Paracoccus sp. TaxID=267 RepID=UPI0028ABCCCD|nr:hypothetical protein [Paracoccus sp. (in: a-proteobacteria)]
MIPRRVAEPAGPVVSLDELRDHLLVNPGERDSQIEALEVQAVAHLDGYRGILGRCILPQQWVVDYNEAGTFRLPLPDVSAATAVDEGGASVEISLCSDALGSVVTIPGPCTVTMTCAMPPETLDAVKGAICIWVQKRFDGLTGPEGKSFDDAFNDQIAALRWTRV